MHAASETCPFLAFSSFSACRYRALLSLHVSRAASMRYTDTKAACRS
nr:MAG TPA: hypothetical protein [Caudoviricetes sp.]